MRLLWSALLTMAFSISSANADNYSCEIIAKAFDTNICVEDIEETSNRLKSRLSSKQLLKNERQKLAYKIREIGIGHLLDNKSFTPTENEVKSYISFSKKTLSAKQKGNQKIVQAIKIMLDTHEYEERHRVKLEKALETFSHTLKRDERNKAWRKTFISDIEKRFGKEADKLKVEINEKDRERQKKNARIRVKSWKKNKALHKKYGGRIIFQQFGIEPIDAYQALIDDIINIGELKILKIKYKGIFDASEAYNKSKKHGFIAEDSFAIPLWVAEIDEYSFLETINYYKAVPYK